MFTDIVIQGNPVFFCDENQSQFHYILTFKSAWIMYLFLRWNSLAGVDTDRLRKVKQWVSTISTISSGYKKKIRKIK